MRHHELISRAAWTLAVIAVVRLGLFLKLPYVDMRFANLGVAQAGVFKAAHACLAKSAAVVCIATLYIDILHKPCITSICIQKSHSIYGCAALQVQLSMHFNDASVTCVVHSRNSKCSTAHVCVSF